MRINSLLLPIIILCNIIMALAIKRFLNVDKLMYFSLSENLSNEQLQEFLKMQSKWELFSYIIVAIFLLVKICIISTVIFIGCFFFNNNKLRFQLILSLIIKAELIFLLIPISKLVWFYFFQTNYTLEDIQFFYPLSMLNIIGYKGLEPWLIYPLQTLNLFELTYIIFLSYQIGNLTKTNADTGLKIVGSSYVPALVLWVAVVMFFTLNYS